MPTKEINISKTLENGLRFSCQFCGECCRGFEEGEVYLYLDDIQRLADVLNLKGKSGLKKFAKKYLKIVSDSFYWKEPGAKRGKNYSFKTLSFKFIGDDEHCEFLGDDNKCIIYDAAPFQCRSFPFWKMMVSDPKNMEEYSKKCPGLRDSNGDNAMYYSMEEIFEWAKKEQDLEKAYFLKMRENNFDIFKVYDFLPKGLPTDEDK